MNVKCPHCCTLYFDAERLSNSSQINPKFGICCLQGQVKLDLLQHPLQALRKYLYGIEAIANSFCDKIRQYNSAFAFISTAVKLDQAILNGHGPYSFCMHGDLHHQMGALLPNDNHDPAYAQLYIHDCQAALNVCNARNPALNPIIMTELQAMINDTHLYVALYKRAYNVMIQKPPEE